MARTVMTDACITGNHELLLALFDLGVDVDSVSMGRKTSLMHAVRGGHFVTVQTLLDHNANVTLMDSENMNAITLACWYDHMDVLKALLRETPDLNSFGWEHSPLKMAIGPSSIEIVELLFQAGAVIPDERLVLLDISGALWHGRLTGRWQRIVKLLYKYGCDLSKMPYPHFTKDMCLPFIGKPVQSAPKPRRPVVSLCQKFRLF